MATPFDWCALSREDVKAQLATAEMASSRALAGATLYELRQGNREWLLVALPGGEGLSIDLRKPPKPPAKRRRADDAPKA